MLIAGATAFGQNAVLDWNTIAVTTALAGNPSLSHGSATLDGATIYLAYVHIAIYNAVNSIDRPYRPYGVGLIGERLASMDDDMSETCDHRRRTDLDLFVLALIDGGLDPLPAAEGG